MGNIPSFLDQNVAAFIPSASWSVDQIPDLIGKVVIVTGGNAGLGKETVKALLSHNAKVYIAARNSEKAQQTIQELKIVTGKEAYFLPLDLADLVSIKAAVNQYNTLETRLDILYNNAGVMAPGVEELTKQGYDLQFGVNTLGHFLLTKLLLPTLLSTVKLPSNDSPRVVTTSSWAHYTYPDIEFNSLKDSPTRRRMGAHSLYGQTNFIKVLFARELAERYGKDGIISLSINPGSISTGLFKNLPYIVQCYVSLLKPGPDVGAITQLRAGTDPDLSKWNGQYIKPWGRVGGAHSATESEALRREIWDFMEEQVKDLC